MIKCDIYDNFHIFNSTLPISSAYSHRFFLRSPLELRASKHIVGTRPLPPATYTHTTFFRRVIMSRLNRQTPIIRFDPRTIPTIYIAVSEIGIIGKTQSLGCDLRRTGTPGTRGRAFDEVGVSAGTAR